MENFIIKESCLSTLLFIFSAMKTNPPKADKIPHTIVKHGHSRVDDYFWMNQRDAEPVLKYLNEENEYAKVNMSSYQGLQEELYKEIIGRIDQKDESVPYYYNEYFYYSRYEEGKEYPIYCRKNKSLDNAEEIILNVNELAVGKAFCSVANVEITNDQKYVVYSVDYVSRRQYEIYFKNRVTGELDKTVISNTSGEFVIANDSKTIFYTKKDAALRPFQVYRFSMDSRESHSKLIFQEDDEMFVVGVNKSKTDDYIFISTNSTLTSEIQYLSANEPNSEFTVFHPREKGMEYSVHHAGNKFYVITNWNAVNYKIMSAVEGKTKKEEWEEVVAHRDEVLIQDIEVFEKYLVIDERLNGLTQFRVIDLNNAKSYHVDFGEPLYAAGFYNNHDYRSVVLRYSFSSLKTPSTVIDINLETQNKEIKKVQKVIGGHDPNAYVTERVWATAPDGKKVPMSIVYAKGTPLNGQQPALLYGYGSYGIIVDPQFSSARLSLLDRGFVFAIAHIRGGQDLGRQWYEDGKFLNKMNTFSDFIACAEYLISNKYAAKNNLFAMGGSAGGMLMGGIANQRPDLFKGIVAQVPFVDVVTTMLDESIPLTVGEYEEWGNPNDEKFYHYMLSYSPCDNVLAQDYPNMLVVTGYHDSQVQYWEPAKWVAKLRELKTDQNMLLFKCNMDTGHGGASGRYQRFQEVATEYSFLISTAKNKS